MHRSKQHGPENDVTPERDVNVLLEFSFGASIQLDELDQSSDEVLDAVVEFASEIALGPTVALHLPDAAIRLRFDLVAQNDAIAYRKISEIVEVIETHTSLEIVTSKSAVESDSRELAACI